MIGRSKELEDVGRVASSFPTYLGKIEATLLAGYLIEGQLFIQEVCMINLFCPDRDLLKKYTIFSHRLSPVGAVIRNQWHEANMFPGQVTLVWKKYGDAYIKKRLKIPKEYLARKHASLSLSYGSLTSISLPGMLHYSKGGNHDLIFPSCGIASLFHLAGLSHFFGVRISSLAILMAMHCTRKPS